MLEAHLVLGGELREADTLPGTPVLPICGMLPAADVMRASSGLGADLPGPDPQSRNLWPTFKGQAELKLVTDG